MEERQEYGEKECMELFNQIGNGIHKYNTRETIQKKTKKIPSRCQGMDDENKTSEKNI